MPVAVTCRVLGFSRQAYYKWIADPISERELADAYLSNAAVDVHADDKEFGYRFIYDELVDAGHACGENRVQRLCARRGLFSVHSRKRGKNRRPGPPVHDDLIGRDFTATRPYEKWLTDITEHPTAEGKLYVCAVRDCYSGRIVGYSIDTRMKSALAVSALRNAVALRSPSGTIVHSDRGSQFRSRKYVNELHRAGLAGSMGRVGAAGDNAAMESFFALLQKNVLNRKRWDTREELRLAIVTWIQRTYHRRRRQRRLGRLTPVKFEMIHTHAAQAA
ncbi:MAG: integrase [Thermoleophilia bacterium]|nr:integrase [Thermoleophilia bacterium]